MTSITRPRFQADWWSKTLAGIVAGLSLSYGLIALFAWFGPGGIDAANKVQFNMWMISPLWLTILSLVYLFPTGKRAWSILLLNNALVYAFFFILRSL